MNVSGNPLHDQCTQRRRAKLVCERRLWQHHEGSHMPLRPAYTQCPPKNVHRFRGLL